MINSKTKLKKKETEQNLNKILNERKKKKEKEMFLPGESGFPLACIVHGRHSCHHYVSVVIHVLQLSIFSLGPIVEIHCRMKRGAANNQVILFSAAPDSSDEEKQSEFLSVFLLATLGK